MSIIKKFRLKLIAALRSNTKVINVSPAEAGCIDKEIAQLENTIEQLNQTVEKLEEELEQTNEVKEPSSYIVIGAKFK